MLIKAKGLMCNARDIKPIVWNGVIDTSFKFLRYFKYYQRNFSAIKTVHYSYYKCQSRLLTDVIGSIVLNRILAGSDPNEVRRVHGKRFFEMKKDDNTPEKIQEIANHECIIEPVTRINNTNVGLPECFKNLASNLTKRH